MLDIGDVSEKVKGMFTLEKFGENLPIIIAIGAGVVLLDKVISICDKLEPVYNKIKARTTKEQFFEVIDTIGDNIQLIDLIFKSLKVNIGEENLDKIADFLQNVSVSGKYISKLIGAVSSKNVGSNKSLGYKEY